MAPALGLVLTSGGARGAYQAGAIRALAEISKGKQLPFSVLSGVSAGSINAIYLASQAQDFMGAADRIFQLWSNLRASDVFLTDSLTLTRTGFAFLSDLGLGGWIGIGRGKALLLTSPLEQLLNSKEVLKGVSYPLRHLLKGLGVSGDSGSELLSYLAFDSAYTQRLAQLGYEDTMASKEALLEFMAV